MWRIAAILALAISVAACSDFISTMTDGFNQAKAVEAEVEQSTGAKPRVGFNSHNGKLTSITVMFPGLYESKPLSELAEIVRAAVRKNFKQAPGAIVLSFAVRPDSPVPHLEKLPIGDGESAVLPRE